MQLPLLRQALLCCALGPVGLLYCNVHMAINATLATLVMALAIPEQTLLVWITSCAVSIVIGVLLMRAEHRRQSIDNFHLSRYVGTVSCRQTQHTARRSGYQQLIRKHKFRRRAGFMLHACLGITCLLICTVVVHPESMLVLIDWQHENQQNHSRQEPLLGAAVEREYETIPLLNRGDGGDFTIRSTNMVAGENGHYRTELNVHCRDNTTSLLLSSAEILGTEQSTVTIETKGKRIQRTTWYIQRDYHTAYAPAPITTLKRIDRYPQVDFLYQPFDTSEQRLARFDGQLISTAIASIRKDCRW